MKYIWFVIGVLLLLLGARIAHSFAYSYAYTPVSEAFYLSPRDYSIYAVLERFGGTEWGAFNDIVEKESQWKVLGLHYPISKKSSATGLCGFLNQTWIDYGYKKTEDPYIQIDACLDYIEKRYKNPREALIFHDRHGWF